MAVRIFGGKTLDDILEHISNAVNDKNNLVKTIRISDDDDNIDESKEISQDSERVNISKLWWVDSCKSDTTEEIIINIIAPFLKKDTFKATLETISDREFVNIEFENDSDKFESCKAANFKINTKLNFKFEAAIPGFKIIKKLIKTSYKDGVVSISIPSEKPKSKKESEFTIGLS